MHVACMLHEKLQHAYNISVLKFALQKCSRFELMLDTCARVSRDGVG